MRNDAKINALRQYIAACVCRIDRPRIQCAYKTCLANNSHVEYSNNMNAKECINSRNMQTLRNCKCKDMFYTYVATICETLCGSVKKY